MKQAALFLLAIVSNSAELPTMERRAFLPGLRGESFPKFQNGLAVVADFTEPNIHTFDRDGNPVWSVKLHIPGTAQITIRDVTVSPAGIVGVSGTAFSAEGSVAAFLAWVGRNGIQHMVRTTPFTAMNVCFSSDGKLWAFGREHTPDYKREIASYDMIHIYDRDGKFLNSSLPRSTLAFTRRHPGIGAYLVASDDRMGFYTPISDEWIEIPLDGTAIRRFRGPNGERVAGVAIIAGDVFVGVPPRNTQPVSSDANRNEIALFRLDRIKGTWAPVSTASSTGFVYGADNGFLIIGKRVSELHWVRPTP